MMVAMVGKNCPPLGKGESWWDMVCCSGVRNRFAKKTPDYETKTLLSGDADAVTEEEVGVLSYSLH